MKLLYKELRLAAHPTLFVFPLLGALVIVPSYPYAVIFLFGCLAPFITFLFARENNDSWYTAVLPIQKRDVVKAKCMLIMLVQLGQMLISLPFAIIRVAVNIPNNPVGMDANPAWYGMGLIIFSLFNLIFFPAYYRSGYKAGRSFLLALIPVVLGIVLTEGIVHVPNMSWLDSTTPLDMVRQLPIFIIGCLCYILCMLLAYSIAARRFERVDL